MTDDQTQSEVGVTQVWTHLRCIEDAFYIWFVIPLWSKTHASPFFSSVNVNLLRATLMDRLLSWLPLTCYSFTMKLKWFYSSQCFMKPTLIYLWLQYHHWLPRTYTQTHTHRHTHTQTHTHTHTQTKILTIELSVIVRLAKRQGQYNQTGSFGFQLVQYFFLFYNFLILQE